MPLTELDRGEKVDFHCKLYEREMDILDKLCAKYQTSRAAVVGQMLRDYDDKNPIDIIPTRKPGVRTRRR